MVRCSPTEFTEYTEFGSVDMQQGCHTLLICEHPCSSVGDSSLPEGSVCAFCGNIFSPTDGTDGHRLLWCAVLPQNSQNTQNWAAWVWQGCHTLLICEHLWEALLCQKVLCVPCVLREYPFSHGWHGSTQIVRCAVLPQMARNLAAWVWQGCHTLLICEHPCSSVGGSSLPEGSVCSVRSVGISFLPRISP